MHEALLFQFFLYAALLLGIFIFSRNLYRLFFGKATKKNEIIAFFHPYCCHGGGGERVLWDMILCLLTNVSFNHVKFIIYTGEIEIQRADVFTLIKVTQLYYVGDFLYHSLFIEAI